MKFRKSLTVAAAASVMGLLGAGTASAAPQASRAVSVSASISAAQLTASPAAVTVAPGSTAVVEFTASGGDGAALTWSAPTLTGGYGLESIAVTPSGAEDVTITTPAVLPAAGSVAVSVSDGTGTTVATVAITSGAQVTADLSEVRTTAASAVPHLSRGHAVSIANTRENVVFTSDKATWVYFTIVGPGAINGHQGWVDASAGLNEGAYAGLESGHGYAVFFTPVAAQGSVTPVAGARTGYVYFVTGK